MGHRFRKCRIASFEHVMPKSEHRAVSDVSLGICSRVICCVVGQNKGKRVKIVQEKFREMENIVPEQGKIKEF